MQKGLVTVEQLEAALKEQVLTKEFLGSILIRKKHLKEKDFLRALSEQFGLAVVNLKNSYIDWKIAEEFSPSLILDYQCFPFQKDDRWVTLAIINPFDAWALQKAENEAKAKSMSIKYVICSQEDMQDAIERYRFYMKKKISNLLI